MFEGSIAHYSVSLATEAVLALINLLRLLDGYYISIATEARLALINLLRFLAGYDCKSSL